MTKSTHFMPVKTNELVRKLEKLYKKKIVMLHGVLVSIVQIEMLGSLRCSKKSYRRVSGHS